MVMVRGLAMSRIGSHEKTSNRFRTNDSKGARSVRAANSWTFPDESLFKIDAV